jgi:hypothetical protein
MSPPTNASLPTCPKCRQPMLRVGELPQLDQKLPLDVYKCFACREVALIKPTK